MLLASYLHMIWKSGKFSDSFQIIAKGPKSPYFKGKK
jgi:hypothetical protein